MNNNKWREVAEVVGVISIVAGLILVAWEIRQANNIAKAQMVMELASQANEFNSSTFENPDVADLVTIMWEPGGNQATETQRSMMQAVAWHFSNIFWSAQRAYDNGLLGDDDILMYQASVAWHLENHPGLLPEFKKVYDTAPWLREMLVFQPLHGISCEADRDCIYTPVDE
jgi:hypothetical protein